MRISLQRERVSVSPLFVAGTQPGARTNSVQNPGPTGAGWTKGYRGICLRKRIWGTIRCRSGSLLFYVCDRDALYLAWWQDPFRLGMHRGRRPLITGNGSVDV